ncbi:hypothetical protein HYE67_004171 [Fusarium culmorum]|uniref:Uncharacterized protein n=1 Tax=Fusarium culmorum TaxID=5516 RepID=A0A2T4GL77_FUSCU|nr:hypothetical protein FCULG_00001364 [Fusarium culmorum]QPC61940.1 hypothetical protein HYE67_004171 [Fusarium culmorum]
MPHRRQRVIEQRLADLRDHIDRADPEDVTSLTDLLDLFGDAPHRIMDIAPTSPVRDTPLRSRGSLDFGTGEMLCFHNSALCKDMTQALHNLLAKERRGRAPEQDSILQRYHVVKIESRTPSLGHSMRWENCDREPGVGSCHDDLRCFNPNECAVKYVKRFCLDRDVFRRYDIECEQANRVFNVYKSQLPSRYAQGCSNAVTNMFCSLFIDSHDIDDVDDWDPRVHGVLSWNYLDSYQKFANDFYFEIMVTRARGNMREFHAGRWC